jgi:glutaminyl-peptide cyclotransferase
MFGANVFMSIYPRVFNRKVFTVNSIFNRTFFLLASVVSFCCQGGQVEHSTPIVLKAIPHDTAAFTQGLLYHSGLLYESTGLVGESTLRSLDPANGNVLKKIAVPDLFAEGLALMGSELVQLSWQEGTALTYTLLDLTQKSYYRYSGEGWGLTSDSASFIMSDGSDTLFVRAKDFSVKKKIPVTLNGRPVKHLNELEYVKGIVYANIWYKNDIVAIRLKTGIVERVIDCTGLVRQARVQSSENVLNGIAFNPATQTFFVTGKNWPVMFEVKW